MEASITGAGLVLAVYALIIPMFHRIFDELNSELNDALMKFEEVKSKITAESSKKEMKQLNDLSGNIRNLKKLPSYLFSGVLITFMLYLGSTLLDSTLLINQNYNDSATYFVTGIFISATVAFFMVGLLAINMVYSPMEKEFEQIMKKQNELPSNSVLR